MKKHLLTLLLLFFIAITASAQGQQKNRPHFSPEEADAFFPLFFELQMKKFDFERAARKDFKRQRGEQMTEEECRKFVYNMADVKIEIAKLEREYIDKYLEVLPACKVRRVQHAENSFQRDLMKKMIEHRNNKAE